MILNTYPEELKKYIKEYDKDCPFCNNILKIERTLSYDIIEKCNNCINNNHNKICSCKKQNIYIKTITCKYCYNKKYSRSIYL
jgi:hypothetical protein